MLPLTFSLMGWYCTDTTAVTNTLSFVCRSEEATGSTTKEKRLHPHLNTSTQGGKEVVVHGWKETVPPGSEKRQVSTRGYVHVEPRILLRARSSVIGKFAFAPSYLRLHSNVQLLNARGYFRDDLSLDCIGLHVLWERKYAHMASNSIHLTILVHTERQKTSIKLFW